MSPPFDFPPRPHVAIRPFRLEFCRVASLGLGRLALLLGLVLGDRAGATEGDDPMIPGPLAVGFTRSCFLNINRNDAEASFKAFLETVGRRRGYLIQPITRIFDEERTFASAIQSGEIQIAIMTSWQFLTMDIQRHVDPCFVPEDRQTIGKRYLLLTHRQSGLKTLPELQGKKLNALVVANANLGRHWLDTQLLADAGVSPEKFFGEIESAPKPTAAVLPVFFRKSDCCLVDQSAFDLMIELNPRVGQDLQVIAASETFLDLVICLGQVGWNGPSGREDAHRSLAELHLDPAGQQILTLFRVGRLVPFRETQLAEVRRLLAHQTQLQQEAQP